MTIQEQYDNIIRTIEEIIAKRPHDYLEKMPTPNEISAQAFSAGGHYGLDGKEINHIFNFLTGQTFKQYFDARVDMYAYKVVINQAEYDIEELQNIAGTSESNLIKRFRKTFGEAITPKSAFDSKDTSLYVPPRYWAGSSEEQQQKIEALLQEIAALKESEDKARASEAEAREAEKVAREEAAQSKIAEKEARTENAALKESEGKARASEAEAREAEKAARKEAAQSKIAEEEARTENAALKESEGKARASEAEAREAEKAAREEAAQSKIAEEEARKSEQYARASEEQARCVATEHKEEARRAKLAHKELKIGFLLVIAAIAIAIGCLIKNSWSGEYVGITTSVEDETTIARIEHNTTYTIKPFKNRIIVTDSNGSEKSLRIKLKKNTITWTDSGSKITFIGTMFNDGSIVFYEYKNGEQINDQFRLVRLSSYEKWKSSWDGYYEVFIDSDGYSVQNGYSVQINLDLSMFIFAEILGDDVQVGSLVYSGPEHLVFTLPSVPNTVLQANLTGRDTFTVTVLNSEDIIFKCYRVIE